MGLGSSCLAKGLPEDPQLSISIKAKCCNKIIKINVDDTERTLMILDYVKTLSIKRPAVEETKDKPTGTLDSLDGIIERASV